MRDPDQIVHVHAHGESPSRRVRHALGQARLSPVGLPPSAVLVVRRLEDPLPGALGRGHRLPPRWERAARDAVAEVQRRAERPRGGNVPPSADALLFADEAEWRACAALAVARVVRPWWTQGLAAASVAAVLAEAPRLVPAVLDRLDGWGEAMPVLAALSAPEAEALLATACQALGMEPPLRRAASGGADPLGVLPWVASAALARAVAEADACVGRAQAAFLGIGVMLARAPHRLRRPEAVATVARWRASSPPRPPRLPSAAASRTDGTPVRGENPTETAARPTSADVPVQARASSPPSPSADPALPVSEAEIPERPASGTDVETEDGAPYPEAEPWENGTETRLGGVFFLLPVMRTLGWPEAEETTWHLASTTGTWGVLDALARVLLGDRLDADDPLWRLLAGLDGREPDTVPRDAIAPPTVDLTASVSGLPPALAAWALGVLPEVTDRLVDALGLDHSDVIPEAVLLREATVYTTRSHVDVVLPLASAGLAVRRAGLDADPGWIPSVGRVVLFHYR